MSSGNPQKLGGEVEQRIKMGDICILSGNEPLTTTLLLENYNFQDVSNSAEGGEEVALPVGARVIAKSVDENGSVLFQIVGGEFNKRKFPSSRRTQPRFTLESDPFGVDYAMQLLAVVSSRL